MPFEAGLTLARPQALASSCLKYVDEISADLARVAIRRARLTEAAAIGAVFDAAVRDGWRFFGALVDTPMFGDEGWHELVADHAPPNALFVAVDGTGRVGGYCAVHPADGEMHLLFVHPEWSGRGVGRALLAAGHDVLRASGCVEAFLFTQDENGPALRFYAAAGYRPDGTTRESEFRGRPVREVRLIAPLTTTRR